MPDYSSDVSNPLHMQLWCSQMCWPRENLTKY